MVYKSTSANSELYDLQVAGNEMYFSECLYNKKNRSKEMKNSTYRANLDGKEKHELSFLNDMDTFSVVGEWIYYIENDNKSLYKVRTDGTDKQKLFDSLYEIISLNIAGDFIYFIDEMNQYKHQYITKIKTDGTQLQKICDTTDRLSIEVVGDWLYCYGEDTGILKVKVDGTEFLWEGDKVGVTTVDIN